MKIIRNLRDGRQVRFLVDTIAETKIEIELTHEEIYNAYLIYQHENDVENLKNELECRGYYDVAQTFLDGMAKEFRKMMDSGDYTEPLAYGELVSKHENVLSYYEEV